MTGRVAGGMTLEHQHDLRCSSRGAAARHRLAHVLLYVGQVLLDNPAHRTMRTVSVHALIQTITIFLRQHPENVVTILPL